MTIWQTCEGEKHLCSIKGQLFRLVESQEQVATLGYVDTLEEQALLEDMLEHVKPPYPEAITQCHATLDYLLKTPFRYPPLQWGSRFGRETEPSLFYGGLSQQTTLAEAAYYRFVFWHTIEAPPVKPKMRSEHTLFHVGYKTEQGVQLHKQPFDSFRAQLTHPTNYQDCQQLGTEMRQADVTAFEYISARDPDSGLCIALFTPDAFSEKSPKNREHWLCELSANEVVFKQIGSREINHFPIELFQVNGILPLPA